MNLILDSATKYIYVAIGTDNKLIDYKLECGIKNHSTRVLVLIDELLKENNLTKKDLTCLICGIGPGSYTGERVSCGVLKTMSYVLNIPLKKISTLFLMQSGYNGKNKAMIDARRDNYFSAVYDNNKLILEEKLRNIDELNNIDGKIILEDDYKVDYLSVIENATVVDDVFLLEPNYLKD